MADQPTVLSGEAQQEGSRWINRKPTGAEVAEWFKENVRLHDGLEHGDYVQGVTLIPAVETVKRAATSADQTTVIVEEKQLVYTPYAKVETRIAYFWDLMRKRGWVGVIEPGPQRSEGLPPGFFKFPVMKADGRQVEYLACSMQVRVYEPGEPGDDPPADRSTWTRAPRHTEPLPAAARGKLLMEPPAGTKMVGVLNRWGDDPNSIMKAETGAVGRALGMAGMLVISGSGVATAEDMMDAMVQPGGLTGAEPALPAEAAATPPPTLKEQAEALIARLEADFPTKLEEVREWAVGRRLNLNELTEESPALRGAVKKLQEAVDAGEKEQGAE